ncbi:nucleoid occlusion factor SlmA [Imbroritus primus]|uniref:nucleoid occlusion factor SlmA n=1 Tax=Imbroritus primus TaxID=3058603 RepID=UPI003D1604D7
MTQDGIGAPARQEPEPLPGTPAGEAASAPARKRPRPGERRVQILQTLAAMLQHPRGEKITTAALAARLEVSEAALYRHFASKAQMFEGLIEFIEQTIFGLINQITAKEEQGARQLQDIIRMLLSFADKNPGMTRVLIGEALVNEDERLQERINQLFDRIESSLKQSLRIGMTQAAWPADTDAAARAGLILSAIVGRWHRYAKSGFRKSPSTDLEVMMRTLLA